ncbi:hypothetical protein KIPB_009839, partial [Kipferlia bialata]|eukprot:g9839.t1
MPALVVKTGGKDKPSPVSPDHEPLLPVSVLSEGERISMMAVFIADQLVTTRNGTVKFMETIGVRPGPAARDVMYDMLNCDRKR